MIFLTFGTGLGAGLILNGALYSGTCDLSGEVGHIRLAPFGPVGFGKCGSFEGFCSGGGIAELGKTIARREIQSGRKTAFCGSLDELGEITAEKIANCAKNGDKLAIEVYEISGEKLGEGLALLIDILNPEKIVIGSAFANDVAADMVYGYGKKNDLLIGISTSGNSKNVVNAVKVAKAMGIKTIALTGKKECLLDMADVAVKAPETETYRIQEYHPSIYHYLCAELERKISG